MFEDFSDQKHVDSASQSSRGHLGGASFPKDLQPIGEGVIAIENGYPLVMTNIANWKITIFHGKIHDK